VTGLDYLRYLTLAAMLAVVPAVVSAAPDPVLAHDNADPAGTVDGDTVTIRLRAATGAWRPGGNGGPSVIVEAFGEEGAALTVPAPLIRVTEGTTIAASVRNELPTPLRVHGLCARDGGSCAPLDVPPDATREVRFASGRAGTYHYWATSMGAPVPFRELGGAFVVDPAGVDREADRVFVITEWSDLAPAQLREIMAADDATARFVAFRPRIAFMINGRAWPATERLAYTVGDRVRWRVINLSSQPHPMHLHGFYFAVTHQGDGRQDAPVAGPDGRQVVTQVLRPGGTLAMRWIPERGGNWLFHCHVMHHVGPERRVDGPPLGEEDAPAAHAHHAPGATHDPGLGMAGMVLGITVHQRDGHPAPPAPRAEGSARRLAVDIKAGPPLPPLVLRRGEPVEITLVNRLDEATSMHWHGLELDSFYDGVHGWSGAGTQVAPMIPPGGSFVARITPPRAGTFIYHTHLHDYRQLTSGLYGSLIVVEPGETFDPAGDHVVVLGRRNASAVASVLRDPASVVIDGEHAPQWTWAAGRRHRLRLINISPDDIWTVSLQGGDGPITWRPLTKDGAPVPEAEARPGPARVTLAVGETFDFEIEAPAGRRTLWLEVRGTDGKWQAQGRLLIK
jgi:FtsP/CotA-like multicopper oxidase with cupredoxin domain